MKKFILLLLMIFGFATTASATSIGFDATGSSNFTQIDNIVYQTDTGLAVGYDADKTVPSEDAPYDVDFILQGAVGTASLDGEIQNIFPVPFDKEWTFTTRFTETVISQLINPSGHQVASFEYGEDTSALFNMYIDDRTDQTDGSITADPNTAQGYNDGLNIFTGHLLSLTSSFDAVIPGELGTGSFDVEVAVDWYDPNYLELTQETFLYRFVTTGTLNQPSRYEPDNMWDGTATNTGIMLKFDGSSNFEVIPEPGTFFLFGFGLLGVAGLVRRKNS